MTKPILNHSVVSFILCIITMVYCSFVFYPRWKQPRSEAVISYDVEGYYYYLPSIFIYKDLKKLRFKDSIMQKYQASGTGVFLHGFKDENSGNYILKYSCGMAIMYLPAFIIGHTIASFSSFPADGFSIPYQLSIQIWGLLFALIGLYYLRKLLKLYYSDTLVSIVLVLTVLGSNYLNYAAIDVGMSHLWLFTLYVFLILNSHYFYQTLSTKFAIRLGFILGLLVLIRPTEIIACLIPLLWGVDSLSDIKPRISLLIRHKIAVGLAAFGFFSVVIIQLLYWYYVSGQWFIYSYQDQSFNFIRPHAFVYSWSYKAGWLRYSPMMLLCFVGFFIYARRGKNKFAVMIFFALNYYVVSAWNVWDYGGFSGRAMVQSYPVLLFTMSTLLELLFEKHLLKLLAIPIVLLFLYINIWWTYQAHVPDGVIDPFCTTKEYYWKMVGRWSLPERYIKLKDTNELPDIEPELIQLFYSDTAKTTFCIDQTNQTNRVLSIPSKNLNLSKWIRVSANFQSFEKEWDVWRMPQFIVEFKTKSQVIKTRMFRTHRFLNDFQIKNLFLDVRVPEHHFDSLLISYWNGEGNKRNCLNNLKVYTFN